VLGNTWPYGFDRSQDRNEAALVQALRRANAAIFENAVRESTLRGMGTTFAGALVRGGRAYLAHVGDSRIYRFRKGAIERLTRDHSVIEAARRPGVILDDLDNPSARMILRAVGTSRRVDVETRSESVRPGDTLLVCSDGLWEAVPDDAIAATLTWPGRAEVIVSGLIGRALERRARDNVTCVVVRFGEAGAP
jgi:serine/threonine protein phosphatase PrpC